MDQVTTLFIKQSSNMNWFNLPLVIVLRQTNLYLLFTTGGIFAYLKVTKIFPYIFFQRFKVLTLKFRSLIYFDLIYEYSVRKGSDGFTREIYKDFKEEQLQVYTISFIKYKEGTPHFIP